MDSYVTPVSNPLSEIGDIFKLSPGAFLEGNTALLSKLLQFNLLWSAVFLAAFWMLWDTLSFYLPFLKKVPFASTFFSLIWFTSSLLLVIVIYGTVNNMIVRIFGFIFILLLFVSAVLALKQVGSTVALFIAHRSIMIAALGPNVVSVNGCLISSAFIPGVIPLYGCGGNIYYQGAKICAGSPKDATVSVYHGRKHTQYTIHRNHPKDLEVVVDSEKCKFTCFTPISETKTV